MEFDQLRTLLAVLEHGSFTRAAEALGISQSTVSFHVKALEASVGTRLLDRNRERVQPTAQGRVLRRYATQLLALRSEAESDLRAEEVGSAGHLAIAASTIPGEYLLPPVLARLRQTHVGLALTVEVSDTGRALEAVLGGRCELALVGSETKDRRLELYPFAEDEIILIGPAHNRFELPGPGDLRGIPIIVRGEGSGTRMAVADVFARSVGGEGPGPMVEVGSTEAVKQCVLAGLGLAFVSKVAVADELAQGRLREVALEGLPVHRRFHAATRRSATLSSGAEALLELLVPGRNLPV